MFNKLKIPDAWKEYYSKYPNGLSILEALISWTSQVDSMIDVMNNWTTYLDNFVQQFDFDLQVKVTETLNEWYTNGFLTTIITAAIGNQFETLETQLADIAISVKSFNAVGDGVTDDTIAIQNALNTGHNIVIPSGTYMINGARLTIVNPGNDSVGGLFPLSNQKILFEHGAILKLIPTAQERHSIFTLHQVENVIIENATLMGERYGHIGATGEWGYGICIMSSKNINVVNCKANDFWADGFFVGCTDQLSAITKSQNVKFINCTAKNNRRQGLSVTGCDDLVVRGGEYSGSNGTAPESGIDFEPDNSITLNKRCSVEGVLFRDNTTYGLMLTENEDMIVKNCSFIGNLISAFYITSQNNVNIDNCTSRNNTFLAIGNVPSSDKYINVTNCTMFLSGLEKVMFCYGNAPYYKGIINFIHNHIEYVTTAGGTLFFDGSSVDGDIMNIIDNTIIIPEGFVGTNLLGGSIIVYMNYNSKNIRFSENIIQNKSITGIVLNNGDSQGMYSRPNIYIGNVSDSGGKVNGDISTISIGGGSVVATMTGFDWTIPHSGVKVGDKINIIPLFDSTGCILFGDVTVDGTINLHLFNYKATGFTINHNVKINIERV